MTIPYRLRRSHRATRLRITIQPGGVEVVAPLRTPEREIAAFVGQNRDWIRDKMAAIERTLARHPGPERFESGARIPYRGDAVGLTVLPGRRVTVRFNGGFEVEVPDEFDDEARQDVIGQALRQWLGRRAHGDATDYVARHGPRHGLVPRGLRIKEQKRIWGSCTARGVLNLNWRLILAPPPVFEYVVVHELCHLRVRNHQPEFWRLVAEVLPDYGPRRRWLKEHGHLLSLRPGRA